MGLLSQLAFVLFSSFWIFVTIISSPVFFLKFFRENLKKSLYSPLRRVSRGSKVCSSVESTTFVLIFLLKIPL